jgi:hypothetical protein
MVSIVKVKTSDTATFDGTYDAMEFAAFVALWLPSTVLRLSSAELAEILSRLWDYIFEQLHLDSTELLPCFRLCQSPWSGRGAFVRLWVRPRTTRSNGAG